MGTCTEPCDGAVDVEQPQKLINFIPLHNNVKLLHSKEGIFLFSAGNPWKHANIALEAIAGIMFQDLFSEPRDFVYTNANRIAKANSICEKNKGRNYCVVQLISVSSSAIVDRIRLSNTSTNLRIV